MTQLALESIGGSLSTEGGKSQGDSRTPSSSSSNGLALGTESLRSNAIVASLSQQRWKAQLSTEIDGALPLAREDAPIAVEYGLDTRPQVPGEENRNARVQLSNSASAAERANIAGGFSGNPLHPETAAYRSAAKPAPLLVEAPTKSKDPEQNARGSARSLKSSFQKPSPTSHSASTPATQKSAVAPNHQTLPPPAAPLRAPSDVTLAALVSGNTPEWSHFSAASILIAGSTSGTGSVARRSATLGSGTLGAASLSRSNNPSSAPLAAAASDRLSDHQLGQTESSAGINEIQVKYRRGTATSSTEASVPRRITPNASSAAGAAGALSTNQHIPGSGGSSTLRIATEKIPDVAAFSSQQSAPARGPASLAHSPTGSTASAAQETSFSTLTSAPNLDEQPHSGSAMESISKTGSGRPWVTLSSTVAGQAQPDSVETLEASKPGTSFIDGSFSHPAKREAAETGMRSSTESHSLTEISSSAAAGTAAFSSVPNIYDAELLLDKYSSSSTPRITEASSGNRSDPAVTDKAIAANEPIANNLSASLDSSNGTLGEQTSFLGNLAERGPADAARPATAARPTLQATATAVTYSKTGKGLAATEQTMVPNATPRALESRETADSPSMPLKDSPVRSGQSLPGTGALRKDVSGLGSLRTSSVDPALASSHSLETNLSALESDPKHMIPIGEGRGSGNPSLGIAAATAGMTQNPFPAMDSLAGSGAQQGIKNWSSGASSRELAVGYQDQSLGYVELHAHLDNGGIHASLQAQSAEAGATLEGHLSSLQGWLQDRHTPVDRLTVESSSAKSMSGEASSSGFSSGNNSGSDHAPDRHSSQRWTDSQPEDRTTELERNASMPGGISAGSDLTRSTSREASILAANQSQSTLPPPTPLSGNSSGSSLAASAPQALFGLGDSRSSSISVLA